MLRLPWKSPCLHGRACGSAAVCLRLTSECGQRYLMPDGPGCDYHQDLQQAQA